MCVGGMHADHKDVEMHFKVVWYLQEMLFGTINGHKQMY